MSSPGSNSNQPALSDASSRSHEERRSPSVDRSESSEETILAEGLPQPFDVFQVAVLDQDDREYGCKYCDKKFSNKQALGGHQNAHKVERALEKTARDVQETSLGYLGGTSAAPFLSSYHRSHGLMNRSLVSWSYPSQNQGTLIGYNNVSLGLPVSGDHPPFGRPPQPGFSNVCSGWSPPLPRIPQFPGSPPYMPNQGVSLGFSTIGAGSSSFIRPVSDQGLPGSGGARIRPDRNPGGGNSNLMNGPGDEEVDDNGLDLTLKL